MLNIHMKRKSYTILRTIRRTLSYDSNTVVSNHFHSVKILLFSSARSRDFDGMLSAELLVSMYTAKTPNNMYRFAVKDRYQLNYFICIRLQCRDNYFVKIIFVFFLYLRLSASSKENDLPLCIISDIRQTVWYRRPVFIQRFPWRLHVTITYNLPHLRLWYADVVTVIA